MTFFAGSRLTAAALNAFATPGPWQTASLINSWGGSGGVGGLFYRRAIGGVDVDVIADIINASATGNSQCATLAAGFVPAVLQNFQASWNNPQSSNAASAPWVNVNTAGQVTIAGIESANHEIFFGFTLRLGSI